MDQVAIRAWGNSQGIRLNKDIMDKMDLKVSDVLDIEIYIKRKIPYNKIAKKQRILSILFHKTPYSIFYFFHKLYSFY